MQARILQQPLIAAAPAEPRSAKSVETAQGARASAHKAYMPPGEATATPGSLPKLDVFPTLQPLTPEEQALANFAIHTPAPELQAFIEAQKNDDAPISISAIDIQPLDPPDQGGN
jgi:hypothetical protein